MRERTVMVTGNVAQDTLRRLCLPGFEVTTVWQGRDGLVALVALSPGLGISDRLDQQVERFRSLGNVGAKAAPAQDDILSAIRRAGYWEETA